MKLTELYFEQVLIGFLVIVIAALPWLPEIMQAAPNLKELGSVAAIGSAAVGIAFFIGIPFDRLADTLTEGLDRLQRLKVAYERASTLICAAGPDPFPEDAWTLKCLEEDKIVQRWNYLRSRIRLTRALAVFGPALTATAAYGVARGHAVGKLPQGSVSDLLVWGAILTTYLIWALSIMERERQRKGWCRTNDKNFVAHARLGRWEPREDGPAAGAVPSKPRDEVPDRSLWKLEAPSWVIPLALLAVTAAVAWRTDPRAFLIAIVGAAVTVASAWSWWRISATSRGTLKDLYGGDRPALAKSPASPLQVGDKASSR